MGAIVSPLLTRKTRFRDRASDAQANRDAARQRPARKPPSPGCARMRNHGLRPAAAAPLAHAPRAVYAKGKMRATGKARSGNRTERNGVSTGCHLRLPVGAVIEGREPRSAGGPDRRSSTRERRTGRTCASCDRGPRMPWRARAPRRRCRARRASPRTAAPGGAARPGRKTTSGCTTSYSSNTMSSGAASAMPPDLRPYSCSSMTSSTTAIWWPGSGDGTTTSSPPWIS